MYLIRERQKEITQTQRRKKSELKGRDKSDVATNPGMPESKRDKVDSLLEQSREGQSC